MTRTIEQTIEFRGVSPQEPFDTYLDARKHAAAIGAPASIDRRVGGKLTAFGEGHLIGTVLHVVPDRIVVQTWKAEQYPENRLESRPCLAPRLVGPVCPPDRDWRRPILFERHLRQDWEHLEYDHILSHTLGMADAERVTVTLAADLLEEIDRVERNRSRFIAQAVQHELARRRRDALLQSVSSPHPETTELVDTGLADWTAELPDDEGLVDPAGGTPVRWVEGQGWITESA